MQFKSPFRRLALFGAVYFVEGAVLTYFSTFNILYLRTFDLSFTRIGVVGGITLIPFVLKVFIGLLSDRVNLVGLGHRKPYSPFESEFFSALERVLRRTVPGCVVVPTQTPGGTDSRFFRQRGVPAYGLIPIAIDQGELNRMHGIDERISLDNLRLGTRVVYDVLQELCC